MAEPNLKKVADQMSKSIDRFMSKVPPAQKRLLDALNDEIKKLDLSPDGRIKQSVQNLNILSKIKSKITDIIITPEYKVMVKDFVSSFNQVTDLTNQYFKKIDKKFKPKSILKEVKKQAVSDTISRLAETGLPSIISDQVADILRIKVTSGGSYKELTDALRESMMNTDVGEGTLSRYARQIVTDSINQYSSQYTQIVAADLGLEYFSYDGTDIKTTRPFCDAMTDLRYFHITEIPRLLKAKNLYYTDKKTGKTKKVNINPTTGLPYGLYPDTTPSSFIITRGGYNCRHQIRPIPEAFVPRETINRIEASAAYKAYKKRVD